MSSEERSPYGVAREAMIDACCAFEARGGFPEHPQFDVMNAAIATFEQQIERRVLAQQPCTACGNVPCDGVPARRFNCCNQRALSDRCPSCTARQTQETSG